MTKKLLGMSTQIWTKYNIVMLLQYTRHNGSEFDVVIMLAPASAPMLLTRNLLYTGITRAKKLLIIVGSDRVVSYMVQNVDSKKRNTGLEFKLKMIAQD